MQKVVLATRNSGKVREFTHLLAQCGLAVVTQESFSLPAIEETALTFIENALLKARHAAQRTGLPAIADDSGLSVAALQGAPGIYSARYAGTDSTAEQNVAKLLMALRKVPLAQRQAQFHCVVVYLRHATDPDPLVCHGRWMGMIASHTRGTAGFGYDPIFYIPSLQRTAAELSAEEKNCLSHRGQALRSLLMALPHA